MPISARPFLLNKIGSTLHYQNLFLWKILGDDDPARALRPLLCMRVRFGEVTTVPFLCVASVDLLRKLFNKQCCL